VVGKRDSQTGTEERLLIVRGSPMLRQWVSPPHPLFFALRRQNLHPETNELISPDASLPKNDTL